MITCELVSVFLKLVGISASLCRLVIQELYLIVRPLGTLEKDSEPGWKGWNFGLEGYVESVPF